MYLLKMGTHTYTQLDLLRIFRGGYTQNLVTVLVSGEGNQVAES